MNKQFGSTSRLRIWRWMMYFNYQNAYIVIHQNNFCNKYTCPFLCQRRVGALAVMALRISLCRHLQRTSSSWDFQYCSSVMAAGAEAGFIPTCVFHLVKYWVTVSSRIWYFLIYWAYSKSTHLNMCFTVQ